MKIDNNKEKLRHWIAHKRNRDVQTITDDINLIEERIISSLEVMELILFIESIGGKTGNLRAGVFRNLDTIVETFFGGKTHA